MTEHIQVERAQVALLHHWCDLALDALAAAREEIDALNVYPVPDGDTGTNLYLTFEAARDAIAEAKTDSLGDALDRFARGALLGARGSSGVILSQLVRAGAVQLTRGNPTKPGQLLADTLTCAADAAYDAVGSPVEGTMLTVARAAADGAHRAALRVEPMSSQLGLVMSAAASAARDALERTPGQLKVLEMAGVVDAGGRGICVIFDAAAQAFTGTPPPGMVHRRSPPAAPVQAAPHLREDGPAYEVMYLLDAEDGAISTLRQSLASLGDSLVVVGGQGLWNVHVHVDDVGAAVEAGIFAGRPHRIRVTHFADQVAQAAGTRGTTTAERGVVAFAAGPGIEQLFANAGATVVCGGPTARCSTGQLLGAIHSTASREVIVLPNDAATIGVAEAAAHAAREEGLRAAVIPTRAQVQGLAALAVHQPGRSFDDDVVHMTSAAGHARHGAVTVATRDAMTMAGPCRVGDVLGVVDGDFALVGGDIVGVAAGVLDRLLGGGGELVTFVIGVDGDGALAAQLATYVEQTTAGVDVVVHHGGQQRYPLLIGVE
ncbi:MAG: DAK2 domain-containing protein [Nocardioidaceae bacterium]